MQLSKSIKRVSRNLYTASRLTPIDSAASTTPGRGERGAVNLSG